MHSSAMQQQQIGAIAAGVGLLAAMGMLFSGQHSDVGEGLSRSSDLQVSIAFVVATCLIFFAIGLATRDAPLPKENYVKLGSPEYDLTVVKSPTAHGVILVILSKIVSNTICGHFIARILMNDNRPDLVRDLARQAEKLNIPVISEPLCRVDASTVTDDMASTCTKALQKGLSRSYTSQDVVGVMDYHEAYANGSVTPSKMMEQVLRAMDGKLKFLNMFVACNRDDVMEQARASDERWAKNKPLSVFDGVPVAVKDAIHVKGYKCSVGLVLHEDDPVRTVDDIMVRRFKEAGAIIVGTTVMTEYGRCPLGYSSHYKGPFNPYDETRYSGGSSSGSVCAVMTGIVPVGISFDGGGSIRLPAAFSGAFGLAPTFGRIPYDSDSCFTSGMIHAGVNTASTTDTALSYALLAQNEPGHMINKLYDGDVKGPPRPHLTGFDDIDDFSGLRIGVFWDYFNDSDPEVSTHCKAVIGQLEKRGATVVEVSIPHLKGLSLSHALDISTFFSAINETHFYHRNDLEPATQIQLQVGKVITGVESMAFNRMRAWAMDYIKTLFAEKMDVFITPGCPIVAPRIPPGALAYGESNIPLMNTVMRYVFLVNLAGFPGMVMPVAYSAAENLPISMQVMGDHWNDALLMRIGHFVEKKCFERKTPKHFVKMSLT
jgi:Asp-tRNA(Asn)/Glu-tRNA(Gln) amidotransferase A subunit family amidase